MFSVKTYKAVLRPFDAILFHSVKAAALYKPSHTLLLRYQLEQCIQTVCLGTPVCSGKRARGLQHNFDSCKYFRIKTKFQLTLEWCTIIIV